MSENNTHLLPDDEHYYFGVELLCPPEAVREHLLRRPEYLYALTHHEEDEEDYRTWLYLWRGNEGWILRLGDWPGAEQIAQMCARHNMGLHVVLHAIFCRAAQRHMMSATVSLRNWPCRRMGF